MRDFLIITSLGSMYIYVSLISNSNFNYGRILMAYLNDAVHLAIKSNKIPRINKEFPLLFVWVYRDRFAFDRCLSSDWWNSWIFLACHTSIAGSFLFFSYNLIYYKEFDTLLFWHPSSPTSNSKTTPIFLV